MPLLPIHRRDAAEADARLEKRASEHNGAPATDGKAKRLGRFILYWIRVSWTDVLGMILLAIAMNRIYTTPLAATRNFPITFTQSGDIVYPEFAYPDRGWIISPSTSGLIAALVPIGVIALAQIRIRSFWDMNNGIMGVLYALILGTLFQVVIKQLIGGFRPYFLEVCQPDISRAATHNTTSLNGVGFHQIMYTVDVCTNPDQQALKNAMTSFPSGHSTAAFAGFVFLFLWMNAKLKVWGNYRSSFWWLALLFAPLLGAVLQACALSVNQAHNWYDILAGAVIGTVMAFASYRVMYASIFDWRYNHMPLKRTKVFDYIPEIGPGYMERDVFVKKLGWGRRRKGGRRGFGWGRRGAQAGPGSSRSSATYARRDGSLGHGTTGGIKQPDIARPRQGHYNGAVAGDQMA
ncbi:acid phosphatase/Vanadium-dependent haloperoxidase [Coniochaeta sp. PMI_546]|nr:acid phosphatase/Vanadium-dependent haloperoxidase [Coniochaeta sp. PMI_546]